MSPRAWCATVAIVLALDVSAPGAQTARPGKLDLSVGGVWTGGVSLGGSSATLTPNQSGPPVTLFETETALAGAGNFELRMSYLLADEWAAEMGVSYGRPAVRTTITNDFELGSTTATVATERLHEYVFDGGVIYQPLAWQFRDGRGRFFLLGGIGYLRDLHDERTLIENGIRYHAGGGAKYLFSVRPGRAFRGFGVRADARLYLRDGGVVLEDESVRRSGAISGAVLLVF